MKVTLESTTRMVDVNGIQCRVWEGASEGGVRVQALIPRIAAVATQDLTQFEAELKECAAPSALQAWPLRMII